MYAPDRDPNLAQAAPAQMQHQIDYPESTSTIVK
jgi:hypothetical protein